MKKKILVIVFLILDLLAIGCLFLAYGPYKEFRNFLITTAMTSKSHKYYARMIYNESTIHRVMSENYIDEVEEETNPDDITFPKEEIGDIGVYESVYEEQILKKNQDNDLYKIIEFSGAEYHAYLVAIYDASRIHLLSSSYLGIRGENLSVMAQKNDAIVAINGGGFEDIGEVGNGGAPTGIVIQDGQILNDTHQVGKLIGFNQNNVLVLGHYTAREALNAGIRDALEFGPFLIVNGKASTIYGNGGWGKNPRTVIAQRQDGIVLFLVIDGNGSRYGYRGGVSFSEVIDILKRYKAYNAANLDGGASTGLIVDKKIYNHPVAYSSSGERWIPNGWMVK